MPNYPLTPELAKGETTGSNHFAYRITHMSMNLIRSTSCSISAALIALALVGCSTTTARQPYRASNGNDLLIVGAMQAGKVIISINGQPVIQDTILNFGRPFRGAYGSGDVTATCKHTKHFFTVENECDVFLDGKFAANLYLR